jgi:nucleotide-binding universal stress UspA family protein
MVSMNKIVLPIDFSDRSKAAAEEARYLAKLFGAEVVVVYVMEPMPIYGGGLEMAPPVDWFAVQRPAVDQRLAPLVAAALGDVPVKTVIRQGDPATEIVAVANEEKADLILLATHGYGGFRRFLLGSVAAKVLSDAAVPVLTSAHLEESSGQQEIRSVLLAVDVDPRVPLLIKAASGVARQFGAALHVVHASPDDGAGVGRWVDPTWRVEVAKQRDTVLREEIAAVGVDATLHVVAGEIAKVVKQVALEVGAGLVVVGRTTDTGILGRLRTNSYAIVREAPCAVLSI